MFEGHPPSVEFAVADYPFKVIQKSGKMVPVVQASAYTKYLGRLLVTFDDNGDVISAVGNPQLLDSSVPKGGCTTMSSHLYLKCRQQLNAKMLQEFSV